MDLPEIEAVERLNIGPDERLAVYIAEDITMDTFARLRAEVARWAAIDSARVAVFSGGVELKILTTEEA